MSYLDNVARIDYKSVMNPDKSVVFKQGGNSSQAVVNFVIAFCGVQYNRAPVSRCSEVDNFVDVNTVSNVFMMKYKRNIFLGNNFVRSMKNLIKLLRRHRFYKVVESRGV